MPTGVDDRRGHFVGREVGLVQCGGNIDLRLLSVVILRGLVHSRRVISIQVGMPDAPGNLAQAAALIGAAGGNILEVAHQRAFSPLAIKSTEVNFIVETRTPRTPPRSSPRSTPPASTSATAPARGRFSGRRSIASANVNSKTLSGLLLAPKSDRCHLEKGRAIEPGLRGRPALSQCRYSRDAQKIKITTVSAALRNWTAPPGGDGLFALLGLFLPRDNRTFSAPQLDEELARRSSEPRRALTILTRARLSPCRH
jgi:hypothetical protein